MRRIVVGLMSTVSALVLLFSYHTSLGSGTTTAAGTGDANGSAGDGSASAGSSSGSPSTSSTPGTSSSSSGTSGSSGSTGSSGGSGSSGSSSSSGSFTGDQAETRWGEVQVKITVKSGKITASEAVEYPNGNFRDQQINADALPQLNSEVVQAQSGSIDAVSGATVTSDGYIQSLQSAIDKAHLS